jgi:site-specific recombinase XerD
VGASKLRHSFMSILIANGVRIEDIGDLTGCSDRSVTDPVYRHEIRPALITAQAKPSMVGRMNRRHHRAATGNITRQ